MFFILNLTKNYSAKFPKFNQTLRIKRKLKGNKNLNSVKSEVLKCRKV